jgi:hypothetical protein
MNRKNLTSAVLAGLAGVAGIAATAQAVNINPDGLGQVLIYPYYTVNGGNVTLLSVVNTTENAKAVKVRFSEGLNTREVLDFNLYLSPFDVWTAALFNDDGTPTMRTGDSSCTVPYFFGDFGNEQEFLPFAMTDGGGMNISRAAEGHFEIIEMATLVDEEEGSASAATHDGDLISRPADCQQLVDAWTDPDNTVAGDEGYWLVNPLTDTEAPSGGLFGGAAIINVDKGVMFSYDARALNGFATTVDANDVLHAEPGSSLPSLNSGDVLDATVFLDDGTLAPSAGLTRGVDAVSYVFMHDTIMNEYTTSVTIAARSEWVVSFPTKHFYVYDPSNGGTSPLAPFTTVWSATGPVRDPDLEDKLPCEVVTLNGIWDREERSPGTVPGEPVGPIVSPAPPPIPNNPIIPFELCYETSVIRFGAAEDTEGPVVNPQTGLFETEIFGSTNWHNIDNVALGFGTGWVKLGLDDYPHDQNEDGTIDGTEAALSRDSLGGLEGLPVTGFYAVAFVNGVLGDGADVLANYGGLFQHKGTTKVTAAASSAL